MHCVNKNLGNFPLDKHHAKMYATAAFTSTLSIQKIFIASFTKHCDLLFVERESFFTSS